MQFRSAGAREAQVRQVKQIQLAAKCGLGTPRAFGHSGDTAKIAREPLHDQAGLRQRPGAQDQAGRAREVHRATGDEAGSGGEAASRRLECSGEIAPKLMVNLMASATDISSLVISLSGNRIRKPEVGLGVVGTKTLTNFSLPRPVCSPVTNPTARARSCGKETNTACLKEVLLLEKDSLTCLTVP